ncbi:MAG: flagellin [Planctomycetota bacterium]
MSIVNSAISGTFRLSSIESAQQQSFGRVSTGLRITRAADDPAGLIASESLGVRGAELDSQIRAIARQSDQLSISEAALAASRPGADSAVERAEIGSEQRALASERRAAETEAISTAEARSAVRDTDYATESSALASGGVRQQAAIYALQVSQQTQASVLDLIA